MALNPTDHFLNLNVAISIIKYEQKVMSFLKLQFKSPVVRL